MKLPVQQRGVWLLFSYLLSICFLISPGEASAQSALGDLLYYKKEDGSRSEVLNQEDWEKRRKEILRGMEAAMGKMPRLKKTPPGYRIADTVQWQNYDRYHIYLEVDTKDSLPAYLYIPHKATKDRPRPAMLVLHGTGDLGKRLVDGESPKPNRAHARELAERGYVVIAPDYPSMGELIDYDFSADSYQSATMKAIVNHIRCVDLLQATPGADPDRIGVIGHSLGGHNAMFVAAFDTRIKIIVASCGWTLMDYYDIGESAEKQYGGRLGPWAQDRYMPLIRDRYELDPAKIPFDFDEVIAALAPRHFFSNSPVNDANFNVEGVKAGIENVSAVYRFFGAEDRLQVRYPDAGHDFPPGVRLEAYEYIDRVFDHKPALTELDADKQQ